MELEDFFGSASERLVRSLNGTLRARGHSPEDAEDLIQDTCLRVLKKVRTQCEIRSPQAYLRRAVLNASDTRLREVARRRRMFRQQLSVDLQEMTFGASAGAERQELLQAVEEAVLRLPPELQTVLILIARGNTHTQIGERMDYSERTSLRRWNRAIELLRADLQEWF